MTGQHAGAFTYTLYCFYDSVSITDLMSGEESGRNAHSSGRVCGDAGHGQLTTQHWVQRSLQ